MSEIDWDSMKGSTHYVPDWGFFKCENGEWFIEDRGVWRKTLYASPENFSWFGAAIKRPSAWSGDGLPPVGEKCEYYAKTEDRWIPVVMIGMFRGQPVLGCEETGVTGPLDLDEYELRPRCTPEQIAAEERNKAIRAIELHILKAQEQYLSVVQTAQIIYDAGFQVPKQ
jgi:hypothetical protein